MGTKELIKEIQRLPVDKRIWIVERILKSIRDHELNHEMNNAADVLENDYRTDQELTEFTDLDYDDFCEAR